MRAVGERIEAYGADDGEGRMVRALIAVLAVRAFRKSASTRSATSCPSPKRRPPGK
jgi:hypothetical protein